MIIASVYVDNWEGSFNGRSYVFLKIRGKFYQYHGPGGLAHLSTFTDLQLAKETAKKFAISCWNLKHFECWYPTDPTKVQLVCINKRFKINVQDYQRLK